MKIRPETRAAMYDDMQAIIDAMTNQQRASLQGLLAGDLRTRRLNLQLLWRRVWMDRLYEDSHPRYRGNAELDVEPVTRVLPHVGDGFDMYPDGSDDETLMTALLRFDPVFTP